MKEIQGKPQEKVVITTNKEQQSEFGYLGRFKSKKGHTIFEFNLEDKTVKPAEFEKQDIKFNADVKKASLRKKLVWDPKKFYASKLNIDNAVKAYPGAMYPDYIIYQNPQNSTRYIYTKLYQVKNGKPKIQVFKYPMDPNKSQEENINEWSVTVGKLLNPNLDKNESV